MSRSGYYDDGPNSQEEQWAMIRYAGMLASAKRGKRGQAFFRDLLAALDAMPEKRLIADALQTPDGAVCAIGSLGVARGIDLQRLDPEDPDGIANEFDVATPLVCEVEWQNDENSWGKDSPESRWCRMRAWVSAQIKDPTP